MTFDLIIIGAGPGGYEMAAEAAHAGLTVGIVERDQMGGTCLNRGCIPTKALCRNAEVLGNLKESAMWGIQSEGFTFDFGAAMTRKDEVVTQLRDGVKQLMQSPGITAIEGEARFVDAHTIEVNGERHDAKNIVIATGSAPKGLPIPGAELAMTSDDILSMTELPKSLCIVGGGVIGMEFAAIFNTYGVEVTVVEFCKEILPPFDKDIAKRLRQTLGKRGIRIVPQAGVKAIAPCDEGLTVLPEGLDTIGVTVGRRGIEVNDQMQTNVDGVYAIGDVNGRMMLAHAASAQGEVALAAILGKECDIRLDIVPSAVFTVPELSMVGLTEDQCEERGMEVVVKKAFFRSNGKAVSMAEPDGLIKMIIDAQTRQIVGCHIMGAHAADLIQEVVMAMNADATVDRLAHSIHGHPTLTEVVMTVAKQF